MLNLLILTLSLLALLWSANQLVSGASGIAYHYKLPPLFVGFILVALGTSAPEMMIAIRAAFDDMNDFAIGNAVGTNIANIGLVLGLTALIKPLRVRSTLIRREYPILFLVMLFSYSLMLDGYIGVIDSCLFLLACLLVLAFLLYRAHHSGFTNTVTLQYQHAWLKKRSLKSHILTCVLGILILPLSTTYVVSSSTALAHLMGVSDLVIALTVVAIGSSLPELTASIIAALKGADDIAIGNILGANVFNLVAVMIFPGLIHPSAISHTILWRDIPVMIAVTVILLWINYKNKRKLARWHGALLILVYLCYTASLYMNSVH